MIEIALPGFDKKDIQLFTDENSIFITYKNKRYDLRYMTRNREIERATMENGLLKIYFRDTKKKINIE